MYIQDHAFWRSRIVETIDIELHDLKLHIVSHRTPIIHRTASLHKLVFPPCPSSLLPTIPLYIWPVYHCRRISLVACIVIGSVRSCDRCLKSAAVERKGCILEIRLVLIITLFGIGFDLHVRIDWVKNFGYFERIFFLVRLILRCGITDWGE